MMSLITVGQFDELIKIIGHACGFGNFIFLHLNVSFCFLLNDLHENVSSHLLPHIWPTGIGVQVTQFVNVKNTPVHANENRLIFLPSEFVHCLSVC